MAETGGIISLISGRKGRIPSSWKELLQLSLTGAIWVLGNKLIIYTQKHIISTMFSSFHFYIMGLLYLKKSGFLNNLNIDAIRRKSMNSILNFSFYKKSGIPEKEGEMASLIDTPTH